MTALTAKQILDLNQSMEAARLAGLGTVIGTLTGTGTIASGSVLPISASLCVVPTGLTAIYGYAVTLSGSPTVGRTMVSACIVGTSLNIKTWCPTSSSDTTPKAATTLDTLQWIAVGAG